MIVDEGLASNSLGHSILSKPLLISNIAKWTVFDFLFWATVLIFNNHRYTKLVQYLAYDLQLFEGLGSQM